MITGCIRRRTVHTNIFETNGSFPLFLFQKGKIEEDAEDYYSYELKKHTKMKLFFLFVCLFVSSFFLSFFDKITFTIQENDAMREKMCSKLTYVSSSSFNFVRFSQIGLPFLLNGLRRFIAQTFLTLFLELFASISIFI